MAKFKQNNVELRDNQKLIFDSAKNKYMSYDGSELFVTTNISGVEPTADYHLGTKLYIDSEIATISGNLDDHSELNGLDYASSGHTGFQPSGDYATNTKVDTTSGTLQSQIDTNAIDIGLNTDDISDNEADITTNSGITAAHIADSDIHFPWQDVVDAITTATGSLTQDHSGLNELDYASSGHTGFLPTSASGDIVSQIIIDHGDLTGLSDDDHPMYAKQSVFATHSGNSDIHFTEASISITESQISDLQDYLTTSEFTTASGDIVSQIPTDYYTQSEVDTISGSLDAAKEDALSKNTAFNKDFGITNTTVASGSHTHAGEEASVFGTEYDYDSSDGESSTSADTPQQKLRLTTSSLPSGTYHIEWGYEFMADDNKNSDFNAQIQINDTTTIAEQGDAKAWKLDAVWAAQSGFYDAALSGVLDIDIDYWDSAAVGVSLRRARLVICRTI